MRIRKSVNEFERKFLKMEAVTAVLDDEDLHAIALRVLHESDLGVE